MLPCTRTSCSSSGRHTPGRGLPRGSLHWPCPEAGDALLSVGPCSSHFLTSHPHTLGGGNEPGTVSVGYYSLLLHVRSTTMGFDSGGWKWAPSPDFSALAELSTLSSRKIGRHPPRLTNVLDRYHQPSMGITLPSPGPIAEQTIRSELECPVSARHLVSGNFEAFPFQSSVEAFNSST
ncbi:hypothetical protein J3F83DRAFT_658712 [Trichoderma novae-zelandiae]